MQDRSKHQPKSIFSTCTRRYSLDVKGGVGNGVLTGRNPGFCLAEDTDDLLVGKTLLHGHVLMWLMKTLLTSVCINQRGAGQASAWFEQLDTIDRLLTTILSTTRMFSIIGGISTIRGKSSVCLPERKLL